MEGPVLFLVLMDHTVGLKTMGVRHLIAQRVPRRNKLVSFKFPTNKNMKNEDAVQNMFQRMGVAVTDAWVVSSK